MVSRGPMDIERFEIKCLLPLRAREDVRALIAPYVVTDPFAVSDGTGRYTVRSVYFDSPELRFYREKLAGLRTRRKLRVRTYGKSTPGATAFLEIKRRSGKVIFKERAELAIDDVSAVLLGDDSALAAGASFRVVERFRYNLACLQLRPSVLVTYDREAYVAKDGSAERVTFDSDLRSLLHPELHEIFAERELKTFDEETFVLELKFDVSMPIWMENVMRQLRLQPAPYSKYCNGIDAWAPHPTTSLPSRASLGGSLEHPA